MQQVFPDSEHRFCVRHLYSNFQQHFKGEELKNQLWACARSSSVSRWNRNMDRMKVLDRKAYDWLQLMPPQTWVRAFFSTFPKCDILLNNMCEVFNSYILEAREMPILSMLQTMKCQLMTRYYTKHKDVGSEWQGAICPKIRKKLQKIQIGQILVMLCLLGMVFSKCKTETTPSKWTLYRRLVIAEDGI